MHLCSFIRVDTVTWSVERTGAIALLVKVKGMHEDDHEVLF